MARRRPVVRSAVVGAALLAALVGPPSVSAQAPTSPDLAGRTGEEAVTALGEDLDEAAAAVGIPPAALAEELRSDPTLEVDGQGDVRYVDPRPPGEPPPPPVDTSLDTPAELEALAPPTDDPLFDLHSRPGADHVVYLDFDGHVTTGTTWNAAAGLDPIVNPPYDVDGSFDTWSGTELARILYTWQLVAEDFAPFDVDVTLEEPPAADLRYGGIGDARWGTRVVVTDDTWDGCGCGGFAYPGSFDDVADEPVFVFNSSATGVAEASTHEVGHAVNLSHDGTTGSAYYGGHGSGATSWGPIMGAAYNRSVSQWSKGEYVAATAGTNYGTGATTDDLAVIASLVNGNGFGYRTDDHGSTIAGATPVPGSPHTASGVIERTSDGDVFRFETTGGNVSIAVTPPQPGGNLDVALYLQNALGQVVATASPQSGTAANLALSLPAGTYHLIVDGGATGTPLADPPSGWTEYGSLGAYTATFTFPEAAGSIAGTVTEDGTGAPLEGVHLVVLRVDTFDIVGGGVTDADGDYLVEGLGSGDHVVAWFDPDGGHAFEYSGGDTVVTPAAFVPVAGGATSTADAAMAPVAPPTTGATLEGTVVEDGTGEPLEGVFVLAVDVEGGGRQLMTVTDANGGYQLDVPASTLLVGMLDPSGVHGSEWYDDVHVTAFAAATLAEPGPGQTVDVDASLGLL